MTLEFFEIMYKTIARSKASYALTAITLKYQIKQQRDFLLQMGDNNVLKQFEELVKELSCFFDVEKNLNKIDDTLICIKFEYDTMYYKTFGGGELCGKLISIIENVKTSRLKDNEYEEATSSYGIKFKCQFGEIDIAIGDFKTIETA